MQNFKVPKLNDAGGNLKQRWFVFYFFRNPDTGKFERFKHYISNRILTSSGRRETAHKMISRLNKMLKEGYNPFSHAEKRFTNIITAIDAMVEIKSNTCRKRSYHTYRNISKSFKEWLKTTSRDKFSIEDFAYQHAQEFMDWSKNVRHLSNRTYNYRRMHMVVFFNMLIKREWISFNPFLKVERLPVEDPEIVCFTEEELIRMEHYLPDHDFNLYVCACLVFYCFLRPQEIMRLRVCHINLKSKLIVVPGYVSKNKKNETIQIPNAMVPVLDNLNLNYPGDYHVFTHDLTRGIKEAAPTRMAGHWRSFANKYGIDKKIYSLKHTGVGMAIERGINLRDLQLQLRHHSLEMTQVYLDKFRRNPSEKLARDFPNLATLGKPTSQLVIA